MGKHNRQVGIVNSMGRNQSKLNAREAVRQRNAEKITRLVEKLKDRSNG